uniref:Uncharacterized protein n=1 Tax=Rhizophora mucronata TaxID=61149 RepID=A0A2P2NZC9_RHIMU
MQSVGVYEMQLKYSARCHLKT